jgi:hypothetical protein
VVEIGHAYKTFVGNLRIVVVNSLLKFIFKKLDLNVQFLSLTKLIKDLNES